MRESGRPAISRHSARASSSRVVHRDAQQLGVESQLLRDELPREANRVALEVVAEREVAEHLEERVVPRGVADLLEVVVLAAGAHAFLRRRRAALPVRRRLGAEEHALELHHARVGEQQRRVVGRHERRAGQHGVAVAREILEKAGADLGGVHPREYRAPSRVNQRRLLSGTIRGREPSPSPAVVARRSNAPNASIAQRR